MVWPDERWMMQLMAGKKEERRRDRKAEICDVDCPIHYLLYQSFDSHSQKSRRYI